MPASRRPKRSREELPHVRGQRQQPRVPGCDGAGTAERSYLASEVSGGGEKLPCVRGQGWQPGGDTPRSRSGAAAERSYPTSEVSGGWEETPRVRGQGRPAEATSRPRPEAVTLRNHLEPEARDGSREEPLMPEARAGGQKGQPEEWWLRRHRRA